MAASDITDTLEMALIASGHSQVQVHHRHAPLSDNRRCFIACELSRWLADDAMDHVRGAPSHPQTQGKIERWQQTLQNRILLGPYNHRRCHKSLHNLIPADVYLGWGQAILLERERIRRQTIHQRRLIHQQLAA